MSVALGPARLVFVLRLFQTRAKVRKLTEAELGVQQYTQGLLRQTMTEWKPVVVEEGSAAEAALKEVFEFTDYATPSKAMKWEGEVPPLFVDHEKAQELLDKWRAQRAEREAAREKERAEKEAARLAKEAEAKAEAKEAEAERQRQTEMALGRLSALQSLIPVAPVQAKPAEPAEPKDDERAKAKKERAEKGQQRVARAEAFFKTALLGQITAQGYEWKNRETGETGWNVKDCQDSVLSKNDVKMLDGVVSSMVDGSTWEAEVDGTRRNKTTGKEEPSLWAMEVFVRLTDRSGRFLRGVHPKGRIIFSPDEKVTAERVAARRGYVQGYKEDGTPILGFLLLPGTPGYTREEISASRRAFWKACHQQPLTAVIAYVCGGERDDTMGGRTVAESEPEDEGFEINPDFEDLLAPAPTYKGYVGRPAPRPLRKERDDRPKGVTPKAESSRREREDESVDIDVDADAEPEPETPATDDDQAVAAGLEKPSTFANLPFAASLAKVVPSSKV